MMHQPRLEQTYLDRAAYRAPAFPDLCAAFVLAVRQAHYSHPELSGSQLLLTKPLL